MEDNSLVTRGNFFFCHTDPMTDMDIQELANLTAGDADVENFERLFTKLKEMKGEAKS